MKNTFLIALLGLGVLNAAAQNTSWKPVPGKITTPWTDQVNPAKPHNEYPRPQMVRAEWQNLNGLWQYAITTKEAAAPQKYDGNILVPFCIESNLSGVAKSVKPDQKLWYSTTFNVPVNWKGKDLLLHFDAVDWETTVWLNGKKVGEHKGGSDPFVFNISPYLTSGKQHMVVSVWDPTDTGTQARGKQVLDPKGIWYTAVTGIWQTVWLEPVAKAHITSVLPVADIDHNKVTINNVTAGLTGGEQVQVTVTKNNKAIAKKLVNANAPVEISIPDADLWTPDHPALYQLNVSLLKGKTVVDKVGSYFAMRKIATGKTADGYTRLMLNNKPLFEYGTLDQGWWPDGLLTPPTEEAMNHDMDVLKSMGFNMLRKHIKVEPSTYYHHADVIGLLIWQDMVSGFATANADVQHLKVDAKKDWDRPKDSAEQFEKEWKGIIDHLRFFPCISVWVTFNEGWGQYDTKRVVEWTQHYDPTRVIDGVTGWTDRNVGDMYDSHVYPGPGMRDASLSIDKANVLGEFGGLGWPIEGHLWNPEMRNWGYKTLKNKEELLKGYSDMMHALYPMIGQGLAAAVYTQTTDVEGEVNGLMTYDRRVVKIDPQVMRQLHAPLYQKPVNTTDILKDSETKNVPMLKADSDPIINGKVDFSKFKTIDGTPVLKKGNHNWFAKTFSLNDIPKGLQLRLKATADVKIWLNNTLILNKPVVTKRQYNDINLNEYVSLLKKGNNNIVAEVTNVPLADIFDLGLYSFD